MSIRSHIIQWNNSSDEITNLETEGKLYTVGNQGLRNHRDKQGNPHYSTSTIITGLAIELLSFLVVITVAVDLDGMPRQIVV